MAELENLVALRLRAIMKAFALTTNGKMAEVCDTSKSAVNNWLLGYNLPRVPEMIRLSEQTGMTLDWLYRGAIHSMEPKLAMSLNRIIEAKDF